MGLCVRLHSNRHTGYLRYIRINHFYRHAHIPPLLGIHDQPIMINSNNKLKYLAWIVLLILVSGSILPASIVRAQSPVVNAVLFYSPSCPACHKVIQDDLPPLLEKYGSQLNIIGVNVSIQEGQELYQSAVKRFNIPEEKLGVPCLIVGDSILVGTSEIPGHFPGIIENGLAQGGISLPDVPGLKEALANNPQANQGGEGSADLAGKPQSSSEPSIMQDGLSADQRTMIERFNSDLTGNLISVAVLVGMIGSVIAVGVNYARTENSFPGSWPGWAIPVLVMIGLSVSAYLSYVELTQTDAICGPVGNCNAVQQSPYARLFGLLPVGVLGILGYLMIGAVWLLQKISPESWRSILALLLWGLASGGVLFSIYLTFLEPFVIGATCAWCITSAIVITLLFLATTGDAKIAWSDISQRDQPTLQM
jgi:uncharacterized membrane protein/thiol-disulfide isomerase/thioredoxin